MEWTRSTTMRVVALVASLALVAVHWSDRGVWFWVGVALSVLNVGNLLATRFGGARGGGTTPDEGESHRLDELLSVPGVAAALAAGPFQWRQVSYLDDDMFEPTTAEELAAFVWIDHDEGWSIGLGDEVKPYVDLDLDEADDPVLGVLESHPAVVEAFHEDREVYRVVQSRPISAEEFAELTARALVAHHLQATGRS